jgi:hypothetical protein
VRARPDLESDKARAELASILAEKLAARNLRVEPADVAKAVNASAKDPK